MEFGILLMNISADADVVGELLNKKLNLRGDKMGSFKMCKSGIEINYESIYECPICGSHDRTFNMPKELRYYNPSNNVRFERCSCGRTLRTETIITVVDESC